MDLSEILDSIKSETPIEERHNPYDSMPKAPAWSDTQKLTRDVGLQLSEFQAYWLYWLVETQLRGYHSYEWSEMKEALQCVKQTMLSDSRIGTLLMARSCTGAEQSLRQTSMMPMEGLPELSASDAPSVTTQPSGQAMEIPSLSEEIF